MKKELTALRADLWECDREIAEALKTRMECIEGIIQYKREHGMPVLQPEQEKKQLDAVAAKVAGTPFSREILYIFEQIIENSRRIQAQVLFERNIQLIGFMGVGKSTVAACLGKMLALETVEMDSYIEEKEGMSINEIFRVYGEEYFRNCESNMLIEFQNRDHVVISCGGGVPLRSSNVELMKKNGYIIWLTARPETVLERIRGNEDRPLLRGHMNVEYIQCMMEQRREKYLAAADLMIETDGKDTVEICEELLQKLRK